MRNPAVCSFSCNSSSSTFGNKVSFNRGNYRPVSVSQDIEIKWKSEALIFFYRQIFKTKILEIKTLNLYGAPPRRRKQMALFYGLKYFFNLKLFFIHEIEYCLSFLKFVSSNFPRILRFRNISRKERCMHGIS